MQANFFAARPLFDAAGLRECRLPGEHGHQTWGRIGAEPA
jgi:hypothetical protein